MSREDETLKDRLFAIAGITDNTLRSWLESHGIGKGTAPTILKGGVPSGETLVAISDATGKSIDWLLGRDVDAVAERGEILNQARMPAPYPDENDDLIEIGLALAKARLAGSSEAEEFVYVPRYNIKASAGNGYFNDGNEGHRFTMAFRRYWVTNFLRVDPKHLAVISIKGDSMDPVLKDGDNILVNHADNVRADGIYVLRLEDSIVVKRTLWERPDFVHIISENPAYPMIDYKISHDSDFGIIGRVVWFGRQL